MSFLVRRNFPAFEEFPSSVKLFDEAFNRFFTEPAEARPWSPSVDILENENELLLTADLPGVSMKDIDVRIEDGTLTLSGERKFEKASDKGGYHRIERSYGSFKRYFSLPESVDAEKVGAAYENGVLKVTLPKKELAKPRSIKVAVNNN
jgi:HSP20 family protein